MADRLLARSVARAVARGMRQHPELATRASGPAEVRLLGLNPVRVLIVGSGLAVGYGVRTHDEGLTGAIARAVHAETGRGVHVQNRAAPGRTIDETIEGLGLLGAATFPIVVWCPSLFDLVRSPERGSYRRSLLHELGLLRATAPTDARIIASTLPVPTARGAMEEAARTLVPRFNAALRRTLAPLPGVLVADPPTFTTLRDPGAFPPAYYEAWAGSLLDATRERLTTTA